MVDFGAIVVGKGAANLVVAVAVDVVEPAAVAVVGVVAVAVVGVVEGVAGLGIGELATHAVVFVGTVVAVEAAVDGAESQLVRAVEEGASYLAGDVQGAAVVAVGAAV